MKNTKKGFTLVELLVVIAILAILASVAVVGYTAFLDKAKESNAKTEAHQLETAIEAVIMIPGDHYVLGEVPAGPGKDAVEDNPETDEDETADAVPGTPAVVYYVVKDGKNVYVTTDLENLEDVEELPTGFVFNEDIQALGATLTYNGEGNFTFVSKSEWTVTIDLAK